MKEWLFIKQLPGSGTVIIAVGNIERLSAYVSLL
jgi:hypothetical protein